VDQPGDGGVDGGTQADLDPWWLDGMGQAEGWALTWVVQAGGENDTYGVAGDIAFDVASGPGGLAWITGYIYSEEAWFGRETPAEIFVDPWEQGQIYLAHYESDGLPSWVATVDAEGFEGNNVEILPDGRALMAGTVEVSTIKPPVFGAGEPGETTLDVSCLGCPFLAWYGSDGTFEQVESADGEGVGYFRGGLAVFPDGSSCVSGSVEGTLVFGAGTEEEVVIEGDNEDGFIVRFDPLGDVLWARRLGGSGNDGADGAAALAGGACAVSGTYEAQATIEGGGAPSAVLDATTDWGGFVAAYDAAGDLMWASDLEIAGAVMTGTGHAVRGLAELADDGVVAGGWFSGTIQAGPAESPYTVEAPEDGRGIYVERLGPDGNRLWTSTALSTGDVNFTNTVFSMGVLADGSILAGGSFAGEVALGEGEPGEVDLVSLGREDGFLAMYQVDGTLAWAVRLVSGAEHVSNCNGNQGGKVTAISVAGPDTVYIAGFFCETTLFGTGPTDWTFLNSYGGGMDIFLLRLDRTDEPN
jgi:hypothetical protein